MEFNLEKDEIMLCDIISISGEQAFENDILLPDYYEDIMKILKCTVSPQILKKTVNGNRILIDGICIIRVYYQSVDNKLKSIQTKVNFSKSFDLKIAPEYAYIKIKPHVDYVNCRAINERRIDVKGALSFVLKVFCKNKENILSNAQGAGLQVKKTNIKNTVVMGNNIQFDIKENLELPNDKPDINNIIRYEIIPEVEDKKIINNKIIFKGNIILKILYTPVDENLTANQLLFNIPLNQIIDVQGIEENDDCELVCNLIWAELSPKSNSDGNNRFLSVELNFNVGTKFNTVKDSQVITDVYSTLMDINYDSKIVNCYQLSKCINEKFDIVSDIDTPYEDNIQILDVWVTPKIIFVKEENNNIKTEGNIEISILGLNADKTPIYIEKISDFSINTPSITNNNDKQFDVEVYVSEVIYNINNNIINIKTKLTIEGCIYENEAENIINNIELDENKPKINNDKESIIIYYAQPGDNLWDIAKRYNTNIDVIRSENNNLNNDTLTEKMMLFIPIVTN